MAIKSTSGALAKGTRNSSPEELDEDHALTEPAIDDIDSLLSIRTSWKHLPHGKFDDGHGRIFGAFAQQPLREVLTNFILLEQPPRK